MARTKTSTMSGKTGTVAKANRPTGTRSTQAKAGAAKARASAAPTGAPAANDEAAGAPASAARTGSAPKTAGGLRARNATEVEGGARPTRAPKESPPIRNVAPTPASEAARQRDDWREPHPRDKYAVEAVEAALRAAAGVWSIAALRLGTSRNTIKDYVKRYPYLLEVIEDIDEGNLDLAESKLIVAVKKNAPWAVQMFLRTKGKKRGYSERQEITGPNGGPIQTVPIDMSALTDEQLDALDKAARALAPVR